MEIQSIDKDKLSSAMRQYYDIKIENMDTIVFFQLGDFYELFFEDAIEMSSLLELTLTGKSAGLKEKIPMAGIPQKAMNEYLKQLMEYDKKVAIVDQVEDFTPGNKLVTRKLRQVITPGTFQSDNNKDNVYIGAVVNEITPKLSYVDLSTADAYNMEFLNMHQVLEEIIKVGIKEVVVDFELPEDIQELIEHYNISISRIENDNIVLKIKAEKEMQNVNSLLITYLNKIKHDTTHIESFENISSTNFVKMSMSTQKQLELTSTLKNDEYIGSLFWFLNKTNTAMGRRLLKRWITRPLVDLTEINKRHNIVEYFMNNSSHIRPLEDELIHIYDFERIIGRLNDNVISPKEMWQLKKSVERLERLKSYMMEMTDNTLNDLAVNIDPLSDVKDLLSRAIKENNFTSATQGNIIQKGYNEEIDRLNNVKNNSTQWLIDFEIAQKEKTGIKNLKVKYNKVFGYFIEVTNSQLGLVPEEYVRKQTMSNCERYITDELKASENDILNAEELVNKLEYEEYVKIREYVKTHIHRLKTVANIISTIDVLLSFSKCSVDNNFVRPTFTEDNVIEIKDSSHPIVQQMVDNFIVNDFDMPDDINTLLITGPNMAGKSTYMRQLALIVIMAQIGMFVSASSAKIKVFDQIFTRIGASDDISRGQSTFMVEMSETAHALKYATNNSLLLFDELGRGTSTYDGIALAKAIIKYLEERFEVKTLFSTHYHELTTLEKEMDKVKNVHVKAEEENDSLTFYHKVIEGAVQKSYGIEVASLAKLPVDIIHASKKYIKELEGSTNNNTGEKTVESNSYEEAYLEMRKKYEELKEQYEFLDRMDINNLTPMQAFEILRKVKNKS